MTRSARLFVALGMNLLLVAGLAIVGATAHSLGLLAAGGDYLADAAAIGVAIVAIRRATRFPKASAVAAAVNAGWLFVLSILVMAAGIYRLVVGSPAVDGLPMLVASGVAAVVMVAAAVVLGLDFDDDDSDEALSHRAVLLDTAADAASAFGVAGAGAVILATGGWNWLDPAVALGIAAVIGLQALRLLLKVQASLRRTSTTSA